MKAEYWDGSWKVRPSLGPVHESGPTSWEAVHATEYGYVNMQRLGPLTMEARSYGLERIKDIQERAGVDLINAEEEARIRELWALNTWPNKWTGEEVNGDVALDAIAVDAFGDIMSQPLLVY